MTLPGFFALRDLSEQVGRPPEEGGQESREPDTHNLIDREVAPELHELSQRPVLETFELVGAVYGGEDVAGNGVPLQHPRLGRGRDQLSFSMGIAELSSKAQMFGRSGTRRYFVRDHPRASSGEGRGPSAWR